MEGKLISADTSGNEQHASPFGQGERLTFNTEQMISPRFGYLSVPPRNMPILSPKNVKQLSPTNRQLPNKTTPFLSPCNQQSRSPGDIQALSVCTKSVSSSSSRELFTDNKQDSTLNRQLSAYNIGQIQSKNSIKPSQDKLEHVAKETRQLNTMIQLCPSQIQGAKSPVCSGGNEWGLPLNVSCAFGNTAQTNANSIYRKLEPISTSIPKCMLAYEQETYQNASHSIHKNYRQKYHNLPEYDWTATSPYLPNMNLETDESMTECTSSMSIVPGVNMIAGQWSNFGQYKSPAVTPSRQEDVIVTEVNGIGSSYMKTGHDQIVTKLGPIHQKHHLSSHPQHEFTKSMTHSIQKGQYTLSGPLEISRQVHLKPPGLLGKPMSSSQEQVDTNVPHLPSPELLQTMMTNTSPSKFVLMKMSESDKYVILSPEKSSTSNMVYKPMGAMKLPPGKYRIHTLNASPFSASSDQRQSAQQKADCSSPITDSPEVASKSRIKISKKKSSTKTPKTKEKKECKRERKRKQPSKAADTKKVKIQGEKKNKTQDKKPKGSVTKPKSNPGKAKDKKGISSKEKKKKPRSPPGVKKTKEKNEDNNLRVLFPCQKFCKVVFISHNKIGRTVHTMSNPVIFFTGGEFLKNLDTTEVDQPVYLLTSEDNNQIIAIMSEVFNPGSYLLSSKRLVTIKDNFISSDLHAKDTKSKPTDFHLYQAVLSPYHFSLTSPMKGHNIILVSQYQDVPCHEGTSSTEGSRLLDNSDPGTNTDIVSSIADSWEQFCDVTTQSPCTHPLYNTMKEMLKNRKEDHTKTCNAKFKLRIQLFDSRRKKKLKICDEI